MVVNNVGLDINTARIGFNYIDINFKHCPSHYSHLLLILLNLILNPTQYFSLPPIVHMDSSGLQWTLLLCLERTTYGTHLGLGVYG